MNNFNVDDVVQWESQSHGTCKQKIGVIVSIVPPENMASAFLPDGMKGDGFGLSRRDVSYLVKVVGEGKKAYWPRVSALKRYEFQPWEGTEWGQAFERSETLQEAVRLLRKGCSLRVRRQNEVPDVPPWAVVDNSDFWMGCYKSKAQATKVMDWIEINRLLDIGFTEKGS